MTTVFRLSRLIAFVLFCSCAVLVPRRAQAQPPDPTRSTAVVTRGGPNRILAEASFKAEELVQELVSDGKVTETTTKSSHVEWDGHARYTIVDRATKNGVDITAEEQQKVQRGRTEGHRQGKGRGCRASHSISSVPSSPSSRLRADRGPCQSEPHPHLLCVQGSRKAPRSGRAWIDAPSGTVLSAAAKLSKNPIFVDWLEMTMELGEKTPLGPL